MRRIAAALVLAAILPGCSGIQGPAGKETVLERLTPALAIHSLWYRQPQRRAGPDEWWLRPVLSEGRLFLADADDRVVALDARDGRRLWQARLRPAPAAPEETLHLSGGIGSGEGRLFVGSREGEVLALDPASGALLWRTALTSEVLAPPAAAGGVVVARTNDGRLYGLDASDGRRLWVYTASVPALTLRGNGAPLIDRDRVYAGFANGRLVALSLSRGEVLWEFAVAVPEGRSELERLVDVDADPVIADGVVYAVAFQGRIVALTAAAGRLLWARDLSSHQGMAVHGDTLYVTGDDGVVMGLDRRSGAILWKQAGLAGRGVTAPVIDQGRVVVADKQGYLHWLAPDDGRFLARYRFAETAITVSPLAVGGILYVVGSDGAAQALRAVEITVSGREAGGALR